MIRKTAGNGEAGIRWNFTTKLDDLDFADDIALLSSTQKHIQEKTSRLEGNAKRVGLKINASKSKIMRINPKQHQPIKVSETELEDINTFVYLGATVSKQGEGMEDLKGRIVKARIVFFRLKKILNARFLSTRTKCYKDQNYPESSRRSMSGNVMFQEFSRTVTH